jgi:hypothetical protein
MADNQVVIELLLANNQYMQRLSEAQKKTEAFAKKSSSSFLSFGNILKGAAVMGAIYKVKQETDEYQKAQAKLNATIASTGGAAGVTAKAANELAQKLSNLTAIDDDVIVGAEAILLRFRSMSKEALPQATQAALDFSAATGKDLNSAALAVGKALDGNASGLTALNKAGAGFTDTQKKMIEQMQKTGNTAGANKIIFDQMNKSFGGQAAAAAETLDGALNRILINVGNLAATIGDRATPGLSLLSKEFAKAAESGGLLERMSKKIGDELNLFFIHIGGIAKELLVVAQYVMPLYDATFGDGQKTTAQYAESIRKAKEELKAYNKAADEAIAKANKPIAPKNQPGGGGGSGGVAGKGPSYEEKLKDMQKSLANNAVSTVTSMTADMSGIMTNIFDRATRAFDEFVNKMDKGFDYLRGAALKHAGVAEKTAIENNAAEISLLQKQMSKTANLNRKKELRDQINTKNSEQKKLKIIQDYDRAKMVFDEMMHIKKNALLRRQFENEKAMKLSQAAINMATGIAGAWVSALSMVFPPLVIAFGATMTALIAAAGITAMAQIASQTFVPLATGTTNVPQDMPAMVHQGEIIVPRPFAESIRSGDAYLGGGSGGKDIVMVMDGRQVGRVVRDRNSRFARSIGGRSYSMAGAY